MNDDLRYIMDVMTGADGGIAFIKLRMFLEQHPDLERVHKPARDFANLIRILNGEEKVK